MTLPCPACSTPVDVEDLCEHRAPTCARCCGLGHHRGHAHRHESAWTSGTSPDHTGHVIVTTRCWCGDVVDVTHDSVI